MLRTALICLVCLFGLSCSNALDLEQTAFEDPEPDSPNPDPNPDSPDPNPEAEPDPNPEPIVCDSGLNLCDEECVAFGSIDHCNSCEACVPGRNAIAKCISRECRYECRPDGPIRFVDLNGDVDQGNMGDGCECEPVPEICDGLDNDCDGLIDEDVRNACGGCGSLEGDSLPGEPCGQIGCQGLFECDENDPNRLICTGSDVNACGGCEPFEEGQLLGEPCGEEDTCNIFECNDTGGLVCEESPLRRFFADEDGDGAGDVNRLFRNQCSPDPDTGFTALNNNDCDDANPLRFLGNDEICDNIDNDCDEAIDEDLTLVSCELQQGVCEDSTAQCTEGVADCGSAALLAHDASFELGIEGRCDGADNNCDGETDEHCCPRDEDNALSIENTDEPLQHQLTQGAHPDGVTLTAAWIDSPNGDLGPTDKAPGTLKLNRIDLQTRIDREPTLFLNSVSSPQLTVHNAGIDLAFLDHSRDTTALQLVRLGHGWGSPVIPVDGRMSASVFGMASRSNGETFLAWAGLPGSNIQLEKRNTDGEFPVRSETPGVPQFTAEQIEVAVSGDRLLHATVWRDDNADMNPSTVVFHRAQTDDLSNLDTLGQPFLPAGPEPVKIALATAPDSGDFIMAVTQSNPLLLNLLRIPRDGLFIIGEETLDRLDTGALKDVALVEFEDGMMLVWVERNQEGEENERLMGQPLDGSGHLLGEQVVLRDFPLAFSLEKISAAARPAPLEVPGQWFSLGTVEVVESRNSTNAFVRLFNRAGDSLCFSPPE